MPKKVWVRCTRCGHPFSTGSENPSCSNCHSKDTEPMTDEDLKEALVKGEITETRLSKQHKDKIFGSSSSGKSKPLIGATRGITLEPGVQQLYDYEVKLGKGNMSLGEFVNDTVRNYYRDVKKVEPAMMIGDTSGKQVSFQSFDSNSRNPDDVIEKQMEDIRKHELIDLKYDQLKHLKDKRELDLEGRKLELEKRRKEDNKNEEKVSDVKDSMDIDEMFARDLKKQQYDDMWEERKIRREKMELENEKRRAEIEKIRNESVQKDIQKGKFGPWNMQMSDDGQWMPPVPPWVMYYQQQQQQKTVTRDDLNSMLDEKLDRIKRQDDIDKLRRESLDREKEFMQELKKLSDEKQNMILNKVMERQRELEGMSQGRDRLDILAQMKQELPWIFSPNSKEFNKDERQLELQERVMDKGFDVFDRVSERSAKRMDRIGKIGEKIVDSSLKSREQQEYQRYTDQDMEEMYKNISKGDESSFYGQAQKPPQPEPITYKQINEIPKQAINPKPEDYYIEEEKPRSNPAPSQPIHEEEMQQQFVSESESKTKNTPKKKNEYLTGMTQGF